jgi:CorA-like Mg2+ transporter protein
LSVSAASTRTNTVLPTSSRSTCTSSSSERVYSPYVPFLPHAQPKPKPSQSNLPSSPSLQFHFRPTPHPQNVRRRIKQLKDYINVTSDWISYALIDDITDAFGPLIQSIEYEVDSIDDLVLILKEAEQSDMLRRIGTCRKKVMGLLRLMGNKADVVKGLAKRCNENWRVAPTSDIVSFLGLVFFLY